MGFFDWLKSEFNVFGTIRDAVATSEEFKAQARAGVVDVDLTQPQWEPIEGVSLDTYAAISGRLQKQAVAGIEEVEAFAEQYGVPAGKWQPVQVGWTRRMNQHQDVRNRFAHIMGQYI